MTPSRLAVVPCRLRQANAFVARHHRHHGPVRGCVACLGLADGDDLVGVAVLGRPVARLADDGRTAELTRLCVRPGLPEVHGADGRTHPSPAASQLLAACRRAAFALGYRRLITYTLPEEGGASLRAAGFRLLGEAGGGSWHRASRPRVDAAPTGRKLKWEAP